MEPAAVPVHLEGRPGPGDGQHRRRQAVGIDADDGPPADGTLHRSRPAAGRVQRRPRLSGPKWGRLSSRIRRCRPISFTGGTKTGAEIARTAAPLFKKLALELGGKNPTLIFADTDLDEAMPTIVRSAFENQGQICLCGSRIFVEEKLYPQFVERFVAGDPEAEGRRPARSGNRPRGASSRGRTSTRS